MLLGLRGRTADTLSPASSFSEVVEKLVLSGIKGQLVVPCLSRVVSYRKVKTGIVFKTPEKRERERSLPLPQENSGIWGTSHVPKVWKPNKENKLAVKWLAAPSYQLQ